MNGKSVFIVSECGTGKSLMGSVIAHVVGKQARPDYRILVVGPPHLTRGGRAGSKWHREIMNTIPDVKTVHVEEHADLLKLPEVMRSTQGPLWVICSRNFLKLGPPWSASFRVGEREVNEMVEGYDKSGQPTKVMGRVRRSVPICPDCGKPILDDDDIPVEDAWLRKGQRTCKNLVKDTKGDDRICGAKLWQYAWPLTRDGLPNKTKPIVFPAGWMKRHCQFDVGIFDEVHELKGGGTAQGQMLGTVAACCERLIALTGTLFGGKASDLYYLMWRLCPDRMTALGFDYKTSEKSFIERYGILQRVIDNSDSDVRGARSKRRETSSAIEKVGIVPTLFTDLLLDRAVFLGLEELVPHLPPNMLPPRPRIEIDRCGMGELEGSYSRMEGAIRDEIKRSSFGGKGPNMGLVAALFSSMDCWPDHPFDWDDMCIQSIDEDGNPYSKFVCSPDNLPDVMYEKDRRLVALVKSEVAKGRRCLVYTVHTQKHSVSERIKRFLEREGIACAVLGDVSTDKREEWVAKQKEAGVKVIITHPAKVETGLDLLDWPTIIFHSIGLKPFTFRQAGARAWRIGQKQHCRIVLLCYAGTMQETIASLMMQKLRAATRLEGQILEDLSAIGDGDDITDQILKSVKADERPMVEATMEEPIIIEEELVPVAATAGRIQQEAPDVLSAMLSDLGVSSSADVLDSMLADLLGVG